MLTTSCRVALSKRSSTRACSAWKSKTKPAKEHVGSKEKKRVAKKKIRNQNKDLTHNRVACLQGPSRQAHNPLVVWPELVSFSAYSTHAEHSLALAPVSRLEFSYTPLLWHHLPPEPATGWQYEAVRNQLAYRVPVAVQSTTITKISSQKGETQCIIYAS